MIAAGKITRLPRGCAWFSQGLANLRLPWGAMGAGTGPAGRGDVREEPR